MSVAAILLGLAQSSAAAGQTTLSETNKAPDIVLSSGNYAAESTGASGGIVLSSAGKSSGKFYAECQLMQLHTSRAFSFGLHRGTSALTTYLGGDADGWGVWVVDSNRSTYHNGTESNLAATSIPALNIRARLAVDLSAGKLWLGHFGVAGWIGGGDPSAGTSPTFTFTPGGEFYLALSPYHGSPTMASSRNRLQLVDFASWASGYPPAGFGVWTA